MRRASVKIVGGCVLAAYLVLNASAWAGIYSQVVGADDPVAYWRLGESSSSQTAVNSATGPSSAGAAANGTYTAGVGVGTAGLIFGDPNPAITITNGSSDRMSTGGFEKLGTGAGYTVEYWTKLLTSPTGFMNMVGDREGAYDFYLMSYLGNTGFVRSHTYTTVGINSIDSVPKLATDKIYHVVTTWDKTTGWMRIYINGQQVAATVYSGANPTTGTAVNTNNPIFIGKDNGALQLASVVIDEAAIYNRPLSLEAVRTHYLAGRLGIVPAMNLTMPVSYWNFDEASSGVGTVYDLLDGNDGSFLNGATRTAGLIGPGAALFNYGQQAVHVGNGVGKQNDFSFTTGITIEALIQPAQNLGSQQFEEIFRKEDNNNRILFSFQNGGQVLSFGLNTGGYQELDMPLDGSAGGITLAYFKDGRPHHVLATYDAATGEKAIWVDGVKRYSTLLPAGTLITSGGTAPAYIGNTSGLGEPFTGIIDEMAIYNKALPPWEIWHHYQNVLLGQYYFAVPEPTTGTLALVGGLLVGGVIWRRQWKSRSAKPTPYGYSEIVKSFSHVYVP